MTREQKAELRGDLFRHLDGIVTAPTAYALHEKGLLKHLLEVKSTNLATLTAKYQANEGYLNVALHTIASQGWINYRVNDQEIIIETNARSKGAFELIPLYQDVVALMKFSGQYHPRKFEIEPFRHMELVFTKYKDQYGLADNGKAEHRLKDQVLKHIEGALVGPTVVALGMSGMFHKYFMEASFHPGEFHEDADSFGRLLDMLVHLGWFDKNQETYRFTEKGLFFARRASAYGVTVSYIPMFRQVDELIFGKPDIFWNRPPGTDELHVDRAMNVWGSGGAHAAYFKVIDDIVIEMFNQPIENQPKGILDMGCGNGAFLIHLYEVIAQNTVRGKVLDEHPLYLIGADYNQAALNVTRTNIVQAGIWAKLIWGDISNPQQLADDLLKKYNLGLSDVLNVRTFLDHNRIWSEPANNQNLLPSESKGAFAFRGRRLANSLVEENLKEHLQRWMPYVARHGLLVIELHTIAPELIADNLGKTAATAYNATHGFSDQFILEVELFKEAAQSAGLQPDENVFTKFPNSDLATVSINLLKA